MLGNTILIGYSGHGYVVAEVAIENGLNIIGYSDKTELTNNPFSLDYFGFEGAHDFTGWDKEVSFILGIGNNKVRHEIALLIESRGKTLQTIIHKTASVSGTSVIGSGTFISRNAVVNTLAVIGKNVILNTGCVVEHECVLYDAVHIAPGAILAGNVTIGERSFIGANAVIKQGVTVGSDVTIGAGSVIISDIPDGQVVVGNPGKVLTNKNKI